MPKFCGQEWDAEPPDGYTACHGVCDEYEGHDPPHKGILVLGHDPETVSPGQLCGYTWEKFDWPDGICLRLAGHRGEHRGTALDYSPWDDERGAEEQPLTDSD